MRISVFLHQRFREVNFLERLVLFGQQFFSQLVIVAGDQGHMSYAVVLQLSDDAGLLWACQHCDGSRLLRLFIFCGLLGIVHIDAIRIRDGKDLDKTQFGYFFRSLQEVIDADNIIGLELIRQSGGQRFYGQGDSNLTRGDVVERHIGGNRDAAHLTGENIVARSQIGRHIQALHIIKTVSHIGGKVVAADLHNLSVFFCDLLAFEHGLGDTDNFRFPVGLPGNGGQRHKSDDRCQYQR